MKVIFYRVFTNWFDFPFNDTVKEKVVKFYEKTKSKGSKKYKEITNLQLNNSETTIKEKE